MFKTIYKTIVITSILFFGVQPVFGMGLFIEGRGKTFPVGFPSVIDVLIDTEGDDINAIEGSIVFPDLVELQDVWSGVSSISLWVEPPRVVDNRIEFSGVVPGGIATNDGVLLFQVVFEGIHEGAGSVVFENVRMLLNDGLGTQVEVHAEAFDIEVSRDAQAFELPKDTTPPEMFEVHVSQDESVFGGKSFVAFVTHDKGVGIDYYEIQEHKGDEIDGSAWTRTESPHVLEDQSLGSYVFVKAVDKVGNTRISTLDPEVFSSLQLYVIYVIIFAVAIFFSYRFRRKRRQRKKVM